MKNEKFNTDTINLYFIELRHSDTQVSTLSGSKVAAELNAMRHFSLLFGLKKT